MTGPLALKFLMLLHPALGAIGAGLGKVSEALPLNPNGKLRFNLTDDCDERFRSLRRGDVNWSPLHWT